MTLDTHQINEATEQLRIAQEHRANAEAQVARAQADKQQYEAQMTANDREIDELTATLQKLTKP
jgi:chromosome segregation ATPase